ncbi:MAG: hypothetical protein Fur006_22680 [Coleofasciculaceae cyanobacterium]
MNILIIVAEVSLIIVTFFLLNWLVGIIFKQTIKVSWVQQRASKLTQLRQTISKLLFLTGMVLCLVAIGLNGLVAYQGENVLEFQLTLIRSIPAQFWGTLAAAIAKSASLLLLVKLSIRPLHEFIDQLCEWCQNYDDIAANDRSIANFFSYFKKHFTNLIWLLAATLCTQFFQLTAVVTKYLYVAFKAYLAIIVGFLVIKAISALIDTLDALSIKYSNSNSKLRIYDRLRHLIILFQKCLEYAVYIWMATLVVREIDFIAWIAVYTPKIIQIIGVFLLSGVAIEVAYFILEELVLRTEHLTDLQKQRRMTIIPLIKSFLKYLIYFSAGIAILKLINIDPTPILAGAGIVGIAVGLGAQNLINDIVCGFFILFENYYLVGDYIEAGKVEERTVEGVVEAIELRTTRIRHPNGQIQIVRNGDIGSIVNYSKNYVYAIVEIPVSYHCNLDRVYKLIEEVGQQLKADCPDVLELTQVDGLEDFGHHNLLIRTLTKAKPGKHFHVQRLLRKILKNTFDREEIEILNRFNG